MPTRDRITRSSRRAVVMLIVVVGSAGAFSALSGVLRPGALYVVAAISATTVPVAWYWKRTWRRWDSLAPFFVFYADVGIATVLFSFRSPWDALPGTVLLILVALFGVVFADERLLRAHIAFTVLVILVLAGLSIGAADPMLLLARTVCILGATATPFLVQLHIAYLRDQVSTSRRDALTGLLNRRGLDSAILQIQQARTADLTMGVALIHADIEDVDTRLGRATTKEAITELTAALREHAPGALIARLRDDEFVCVFLGGGARVAEDLDSLRDEVESLRLRSASTPLTCTTARAHLSDSATRMVVMGRLIASASLARYSDTLEGDERRPEYDHLVDLLAAGGPTIVFQPVVRVDDQRVVGYEALSRFPAGHGSPQTWFADAAAAGMQIPLELAAVQRAVLASHHLEPDAFLAINVSATTITASDLTRLLLPLATQRRVVVEITEHDLVRDYHQLTLALDDLRAAGLSISVDDVGAGHSGLRQLVEIKPDVIKLDASIVRGLDHDRLRRAAAKALTDFARDIGAECIYEGIETDAELHAARTLGATMVQGFLLGRPTAVPTAVTPDVGRTA
ncbi:EAL domain-containing protein [Rhodococcoides corynebacterioides]|uniref:EAL domain-containing protein n=1 Tax=Rhodococcoides corynebacterioides TaxID=53972 RepID=UPI001C9AF5B7|nr:GGDEF domain-containing phosphodiesterase [Rhodococcus corynebacterioides]MBY6409891.1 EAL domain-containing protein [Rhodococcus corynebacterioides]